MRHLVRALIDLVAAILLISAAIAAADQHAWPYTIACGVVVAACLAAAYVELDQWTTQPNKEHTP